MECRIKLEFTDAEAMLLFESITKLEQQGILDTVISEAEKYVFAYVAGSLEKSLPAQSDDFAELVNKAKNKIQKHLAHSSMNTCRESLLSEEDPQA